jgi:hypothetical protein
MKLVVFVALALALALWQVLPVHLDLRFRH